MPEDDSVSVFFTKTPLIKTIHLLSPIRFSFVHRSFFLLLASKSSQSSKPIQALLVRRGQVHEKQDPLPLFEMAYMQRSAILM